MIKSICTNLQNSNAVITHAEKGNSIVILPIQQYEFKVHNFLQNNFQTSTTDPTKTFQTQKLLGLNQIQATGYGERELAINNIHHAYCTANLQQVAQPDDGQYRGRNMQLPTASVPPLAYINP